MSLVGPRPTVASQVELYDARQRRRLLARPGLTGLAQVSGRNAIPWSERIEIDVRYVDAWTPRRDLAILARTARVVLARGGTYAGERGGFDLSRPGGRDG
jgi:lipopolysaccharide/colanic/teichoic acid biosynthesis glycosyltransferase